MSRNSKGITLIVLVITIVVLLILAGVSLSFVLGNEGILGKATSAVDKSQKVQAREKLELDLLALQTDKATKENYNKNEYVDTFLEKDEMVIEDDDVIVDDWRFTIDRDTLTIVEETRDEIIDPDLPLVKMKTNEVKQFNYEGEIEGKSVKWKVSNSGIATVDELGNVTALKAGNTKLSISVENEIVMVYQIQVEKSSYILQNGQLRDEKLGNWEEIIIAPRGETYPQYEKDFILLHSSFNGSRCGLILPNKIDVTDIKSIRVEADICNNGADILAGVYVGLCLTKEGEIMDFERSVSDSTRSTQAKKCDFNLDTSDLSGEYYLKIVATHDGPYHAYTNQTKIYSITAYR